MSKTAPSFKQAKQAVPSKILSFCFRNRSDIQRPLSPSGGFLVIKPALAGSASSLKVRGLALYKNEE